MKKRMMDVLYVLASVALTFSVAALHTWLTINGVLPNGWCW
jgi:hypothetical protein